MPGHSSPFPDINAWPETRPCSRRVGDSSKDLDCWKEPLIPIAHRAIPGVPCEFYCGEIQAHVKNRPKSYPNDVRLPSGSVLAMGRSASRGLVGFAGSGPVSGFRRSGGFTGCGAASQGRARFPVFGRGESMGLLLIHGGFERDKQPRIVPIGLSADGQNRQDQARGAFLASRFKSVAIITVCASIDLNPVAAGIADVPEISEHTSIKQRLGHVQALGGTDDLAAARDGSVTGSAAASSIEESLRLCPIEDPRGVDSLRQGMIEGLSLVSYLLLMDYTGRLSREWSPRPWSG